MPEGYTFCANDDSQELLRLRLIEQALDPTTIEHLKLTGIERGWRCLELGGGAGSIARWMGNVVAAHGEVVCIDLDAAHLRDLPMPPFRIVEGDFLEMPIDGSFDLAHCRYVLIHNRQSQAILEKLSALIKPSGLLVLEEPDFTSSMRLNEVVNAPFERVNKAICRMFEQMQLDPAFGLHLPARAASAGLQVLNVDARIHLNKGGDALARMMAESARALRQKYLATGQIDSDDVESYIRTAYCDPRWRVYYSTISVTATKPPA